MNYLREGVTLCTRSSVEVLCYNLENTPIDYLFLFVSTTVDYQHLEVAQQLHANAVCHQLASIEVP